MTGEDPPRGTIRRVGVLAVVALLAVSLLAGIPLSADSNTTQPSAATASAHSSNASSVQEASTSRLSGRQTALSGTTTLPIAPWPGSSGGPQNWVPLTDTSGWTIRNSVTGTSQPWLRMSSGESAVGARGSLPTVQVASDGNNLFYRLRVLGSPYDQSSNQWQNQGYYQMAIATQVNGQWTVQGYAGVHVNANGRVYIATPGGTTTTIYEGNTNPTMAQGIRVTKASNGNDNAYFVDVQIPISALQSTFGIGADTPIRLFYGTATQPNSINRDLMANTGEITFSSVNTVTPGDVETPLRNLQNVRITSPENGATVTTNQPTITGTTSAGGGTLELYVDNARVTTISNVGTSWSYTLSSGQSLSDGRHTVRAELSRGGTLATTATNTFTVDTTPQLQVTTSTLAAWTAGQSGYGQTLAASGGTTPYTWSVASGGLPPGLSLASNGAITGTPTQAGTYTFTARVTDATGRTTTRSLSITVNSPPVVSTASPLRAGVESVAYSQQLAASGGTTPYTWSVASGTLPPGLSLSSSGELTGTPTQTGTYTFTARVTDAAGATTTKELTVSIGDRLSVATTTLSAWTAGHSGYTQSLQAAGGSGPYAWSVATGSLPPGLSLSSNGAITGTPTQAGTYTFTARVTDSDGSTATRQLSIQINPGLAVSAPASLPNGVERVTYTQQLATTGGTGTVTWDVASGTLPPGLTLTSTGVLSGTATSAGAYTFTVRATDAAGATATRQYSVTVTSGLSLQTASLPAWTVNQPGYAASLTASGGTQPYTWSLTSGDLPAGLTLDSSTGEITGTPTQTGTFPVTVQVRDADGTTVTKSFTVVISGPLSVSASESLRSGVAGVQYFETLTTTGGTSPVTWAVTGGALPPGVSLAANGELTGAPTTAGTYQFTARATDAAGATAAQLFTITVGDGLTVGSTSLPDWTVDQPYTSRVEAAGGTQPYSWSVSSGALPPGLSLDTSTGVFSGTPTSTGTYSFTLQVTDADSSTATKSYTIRVNSAPSVSTSSLADGVAGVGYSQSLAASGGTSPLTWRVASGTLPPGLSLSTTGVLSGTPTQSGTYTFTVEAVDAAGATGSRQYSVTIGAALSVTTTSLPAWTAGQSGYSSSFAASGGTQPYTWQVVGGDLPPGLTLDASTGTLSGTPTQPGTYPVTVQVRDADGTTVTRDVTVTVNAPLSITTTSPLASGVEGVGYDQQLAVSGGTGSLSWSVVGGSLPPGLTLDATGRLAGTPTTAGTYTFTARLADETGASVTRAFTLVVGDGLTLSTATLADWTVDQSGYASGVTAIGGTRPYTYTLTAGSLPPGVTIDTTSGAITGTPTATGTYTPTIRVTDGDGTTVSRTYSITVYDRPSIATDATLTRGVERVAYSQQLTADGGTPPLSWSVVGGALPSGLSLDDAGRLTGTPDARGTYTFTLQVTDASGASTSKQFGLTVDPGLAVSTDVLSPWTTGQSGYDVTLRATGGTAPYAWQVTSAGLPDGLTLDSNTGGISGTPTQTGSFPVTVEVRDADGTTVTREYTLTINPQPSVTTPDTLPVGVQNVPYTTQLTTSGGTAPVTWQTTSGSLPEGLTLDASTGTISGTPTETGTFSFTVQATDATGAAASKQVSVTVTPGLAMETTTLPDWTVNTPGYVGFATAAGGTTPYQYTVTSGSLPSGLSLNPDTGAITGEPTATGAATFTVQVTDGDGSTASRSYTIGVNDALSVSTASLPDGVERVSYSQQLATTGGTAPVSWTVDSGTLPPGLSLSTDGTLAGTPTSADSYTFTVRATDAAGATATKQYTLQTTPGLDVSTTTLPDWTVDTPGYSTTLAASGGTQPYTWQLTSGALPEGLVLDSSTGELSGTPTQTGTFPVSVTVTDADGTTVTAPYRLTVNARPSIGTDGTLDRAVEGVSYYAELSATGGSGDRSWSVTGGSLPSGLTLDSTTGVISGTPQAGSAGTYTPTITVTDAAGASQSTQFTLVVGDGLTVTTSSLADWTAGQPGYGGALTAAGGTGLYTWAVSAGTLPAGLALNATTGALTGTPSEPGVYPFTVRVTDADGTTVTQDLTLTVNARAEVTGSSTLPGGVEGVAYTYQFAAAGGTAPLTWRVVDGTLPPGLTLDADGRLSGVPTTAGTYVFTVETTDATGARTTKTVSLAVGEGLTVTASTLTDWTAGQGGYSQTLQAAGGTAPYAWQVVDGTLPAGLTLDSSSGEITGTPTTAGTATFTVQVTDDDGSTDTQPYTVTVNEPPSVVTASLPDGVVGVQYRQQLATTGGTAPISWTVSGSLPPGLVLDADTGRLTGTPTQAGDYSFTITATDAAGASASSSFAVTVGDALSITTSSLADWTAGQSGYSQSLSATGGTGPYAWQATGLPAGLALDAATGELTGTPTQTGSFTATVSVTDADGTTVSRQLSLTVNAHPSIETDALPNAVQGVSYSQSLATSGGTGSLTWTVTDGALPPGLSLDSSGTLSGTPTQPGTYVVTVTATDTTGASQSTQFTLVVGDGLTVTASTLSGWTTGQGGYSQTLQAAGGTAPYAWQVVDGSLPAGLTLDSSSGEITGTPSAAGTYTFTVQVTDDDGSTDTQTYTVTVTETPTVTSTSLERAVEGVAFSQQLSVANGTQPVSWAVTAGTLPPGLSLDADGTLVGTPSAAGTYTFTVQVTDAAGATASRAYTLTVEPPLDVSAGALPSWTAGQSGYTTTVHATGGTAPYTWTATGGLPAGLTLNAATGELTGTPTQVGTFAVSVSVIDTDGTMVTRSLPMTVNPAPALSTPSTLARGVEGVFYATTLERAGGTGGTDWAVTDGELPPGLALDASGTVSGTPTTAGTYTFTVTATDSAGATTSKQFTLTVDAGLTVTTSPLPTWTVGQPGYAATVGVAGGTAPYTFTVSQGSLPDGLTLDSTTGAITGRPASAGSATISMSVTDADGTTVTREYTLTVNDRPSVATNALPGGVERVAYSSQLAATDGTGPVTWDVESGTLPPGLALDANGRLSGTPTTAGSYTFTVRATDAAGATTTKQFTVTVADGLDLSTASLPAWTVGHSGYSQQLTAVGGTGPYRWTVTDGALPPGLSLDADTGELAGTPTATGTFTAVVRVTDADGTSVARQFDLTINPAVSLDGPASLHAAVQGVAYTETLSTSGGTGATTWEVTDGALPPGLSLDATTGALTGTPTATGDYTFSVTVTDTTGATATRTYSITVTDGLTVTSTTLDPWTVDHPGYGDLVDVAGGTSPYTWTIPNGALPPGLTLDSTTGAITGTPTQAGTYPVTVHVTDGDGTTVTRELTLTINGPVTVGTPDTLRTGVTGVAYSEQLTSTGGTAPVTWSVTGGTLPPGLALDADGTLAGVPTQHGTYTFTVTATDATGASASKPVTVTIGEGLSVTTATTGEWTVGQSGYSQQLEAAGGTAPYTWTVSTGGLPNGLTLDSTTGTISGTPSQIGTFPVSVTVTDADGSTATQNLTVAVNPRPTITTPNTLSTGVVGVPYRQEPAMADGTEPYTWTVTDGVLPAGLSLDSRTGAITGTPTTAGTYTFTLTGTDAAGATASKQFTIEVGTGLTLTTTSLPAWTVGQPGYDRSIVAAGGTAPYSFSVASGSLPPGLSLAEGGQLTGTPTQAGNYSFTVQVTDSDGTIATRTLALTINEKPQIATTSLPTVRPGQPYSGALAVTGGTSPYTWTVTTGTLPDGLTIDPQTGAISGTTTEVGTVTTTVTVTDASGASGQLEITISVQRPAAGGGGETTPPSPPSAPSTPTQTPTRTPTQTPTATEAPPQTPTPSATPTQTPAQNAPATSTPTPTVSARGPGLVIGDVAANRSRLRQPGVVTFTVTVRNPVGNASSSAAVGVPPAGPRSNTFAAVEFTGRLSQVNATRTGVVRLYRDDTVVATQSVRVPDGETRDVQFTVTFERRGRFNVHATLVRTNATGVEEPSSRQQVSASVAIQVGEDCSLFGVDLGMFGICWYWWVLIDGLLAALACYLVQTRWREVTPLGRTPESERGARFRRVAGRLGGLAVAAAVGALVLFALLNALGLDGAPEFIPVLVLAVAAGAVAGARRVPSLD